MRFNMPPKAQSSQHSNPNHSQRGGMPPNRGRGGHGGTSRPQTSQGGGRGTMHGGAAAATVISPPPPANTDGARRGRPRTAAPRGRGGVHPSAAAGTSSQHSTQPPAAADSKNAAIQHTGGAANLPANAALTASIPAPHTSSTAAILATQMMTASDAVSVFIDGGSGGAPRPVLNTFQQYAVSPRSARQPNIHALSATNAILSPTHLPPQAAAGIPPQVPNIGGAFNASGGNVAPTPPPSVTHAGHIQTAAATAATASGTAGGISALSKPKRSQHHHDGGDAKRLSVPPATTGHAAGLNNSMLRTAESPQSAVNVDDLTPYLSSESAEVRAQTAFQMALRYENVGGYANFDLASSWYGKAADEGHRTARTDEARMEKELKGTQYRL